MTNKRRLLLLIPVFILAACNNKQPIAEEAAEPGFKTPRSVEMNPSYEPLPVEESLKRFRLPGGYRLEIVAAEPMISEPAAIAWDGNGRMYVAQMETYMQTIDAKGQDAPISRIMRLEDTDNDGRMDKSTVFIDSLLSPRMILCVGNELLVNETNTFDIHAYKDENGDGVADTKRTVYSKPVRAYGNVEHQRSGLDWNIDNNIYVTTDLQKYRYKDKMLLADSLAYGNNGQWGLTHDDYGRIYFSRAASSVAASGFHVNPAYGQFDLFDEKEESVFRQVWPGVKTPDANANVRKEDSTLIVFTSSCGQAVYRGDQLPKSIQGDYFACEPVGRLVRRAKISETDDVIKVKNVYDADEFITTSDFNFRPVNTYTGPDGCLYLVDMYRGIIQESEWVKPGMRIYDQVRSKGLDKHVRRGRIYRLVHETTERVPQPRMLDESSEKLVSYLSHPNGWWRDNAQKELVVRNDMSVLPLLEKLFANGSSLARLHALWTIDGLEKIDKKVLLTALSDEDVQIKKAAIRISEKFIPDEKVLEKLLSLSDDESKEVLGQLVLSLNKSGVSSARGAIENIFIKYKSHPLLAAIKQMFASNEEKMKFGSKLVSLNEAARKRVMRGSEIFEQLCSTCHGPGGVGLPARIAPPLMGKIKLLNNRTPLIKILLHGLKGPVDGVNYPEVMMSMKSYDDEWIASVLNYVRFDMSMASFPELPNDYLNSLMITPEEVAEVRKQYATRTAPWTWEELLGSK
ncbi:MAG: cytochrome C [Chitinophagaceae bacterium]|nr:cytochrome C [Chitinophagaceae bacterium]